MFVLVRIGSLCQMQVNGSPVLIEATCEKGSISLFWMIGMVSAESNDGGH